MRPPAQVLILDANIALSTLLSPRRAANLLRIAQSRRLATSARVREETRGRLKGGMARPDLLEPADALFEGLLTVETRDEATATALAEGVLRRAPASANGSVKDAHVLVAAWMFEADVWTHDRDFAGTGVASWSTANLLAALD